MDNYYIELARESLGKAVEDLRHAEQYLIKDESRGMARGITRIINSVRNRDKELMKSLR